MVVERRRDRSWYASNLDSFGLDHVVVCIFDCGKVSRGQGSVDSKVGRNNIKESWYLYGLRKRSRGPRSTKQSAY